MQMTWRWYGEGNDQIKLSDIKQIPGVEGIVWALHSKMPGEVWQPEEIAAVKKQLDEYGFNMDVVESVNVHDDIKIGLPTRDQLIENYKQTIRNLASFGVKVICYNFISKPSRYCPNIAQRISATSTSRNTKVARTAGNPFFHFCL